MRRFVFPWAAAIAATLAMIAPAAAQFHQAHHHAAVAAPSFHHFSLHQSTAAATAAGNSITASQAATHHHHAFGRGQVGFAPVTVWSYWSGGYPLGWGGLYTPYYTPAFGAGPIGPNLYSYPAAAPFVPQGDPVAPAEREARVVERNAIPQQPARPQPKITSADKKAKAGRSIGVGDTNFSKQKYTSALDRYRSAGATAPDLPEAFMRQGFALVALGQYANATKAFRRALAIRGDWSGSPMRIDQLYDEARLVKNGHLENLAKAIEANPWDANLLVALGVELYFDGQKDRAGVFFARAAQLGGNTDHTLDGFLPQPGPKGEQKLGAPKIVF